MLARVMRAKAGTNTMPIATIAFWSDGPRTAISAMASRIAGNASRASMSRMTKPSTRPPT